MAALNLTTLRDIERRLAEAKGPDREVDYAIAKALGIRSADDADEAERQIHDDHEGEFKFGNKASIRRVALNTFVVRYTKSLDAAVALAERVLPGARWKVGYSEADENGYIFVHYASAGGPRISEHVGGAALALCLAIIRTLIAKEEAGL